MRRTLLHDPAYIDPQACDNDIARGVDPEVGVYVVDFRDSPQQARFSETFQSPERVGECITKLLRKVGL